MRAVRHCLTGKHADAQRQDGGLESNSNHVELLSGNHTSRTANSEPLRFTGALGVGEGRGSIARQLSQYRKEIEERRHDPALSGHEKRVSIDNLFREMIEVARQANEEIKTFDKENPTPPGPSVMDRLTRLVRPKAIAR